MKNLVLIFALITLGLFACKNSNTDQQKETKVENSETWNTFKEKFITTISKNDMGGLVEVAALPLRGNFFSSEDGTLSKTGLIKNYAKVLGGDVRLRVMNTKPEEWGETTIDSADDAKRIGVPKGTKVKTLQLNYVFDKGTENQTESMQIFYFANLEGEYKWYSMFIAG